MTQAPRQPAFFLSGEGGPCFWMTYPTPTGPHGFEHLNACLAGLLDTLTARSKACLVISGLRAGSDHQHRRRAAHAFDYYGFPPHAYHLRHPAPGR